MRKIKTRNQEIYELHANEKLGFDEIGRRFGVEPSTARSICRKEKERLEHPERLTGRLLKMIKKETGLESPTLIDVQTFLKKLDGESEHGWEFGFLKIKGSGRKSLGEMRQYALQNGILPPPKARTDESTVNLEELHALSELTFYSRLFIKSFTGKEEPTFDDFKNMILKLDQESEGSGWKHAFYKRHLSNGKTCREFQKIIDRFNILPNPQNS